jgi:hypothetical protein
MELTSYLTDRRTLALFGRIASLFLPKFEAGPPERFQAIARHNPCSGATKCLLRQREGDLAPN